MIQHSQFSGVISSGDPVKISCGARVCGASVREARPNGDSLLADKFLRTSLRARVGDKVQVEHANRREALEVTLVVPPNWIEGMELMKGLLFGRVLTARQKLPVFTRNGTQVPVEIKNTNPEGIVVIGDGTVLRAQPPTAEAEREIGITYKDIGGLDREIRRIREIVEYPLRTPDTFAHLGIEPPKGVILYGPPGTGKTLIAKALSSEVGAHFYSIQGPEIVSGFYGESERQLRQMFERAQSTAPSVILIDELDAIAPKREAAHGDLERRIVTSLLTLMDGLSMLRGVVVLGTTNRPEALDVALRRPGRFEYEIAIGVPDAEGRRRILDIHTKRMPLAEDVDLDSIAGRTHGFVGADISALCREAGYCALRRHCSDADLEDGRVFVDTDLRVGMSDFRNALSATQPSAMREVMVQTPRDVSWDDVGGLDDVKEIVTENVVRGIKNPGAFRAVGIRPAKGLLLYGPPGTGKTLLAKAVACECGVNFIAIRGPELHTKWFGESEAKIRFIFNKARQVAPAIVFFDEFDSVAHARGADSSGLSDRVVNQILTEMDGVEGLESVFVIGATNAADLLDPALLRPGRFDLQVYVPLPDCAAREKIFLVHLRKMPLGSDITAKELAQATEGYSGADIAEVCRSAAMRALRIAGFEPCGVTVGMDSFTEALDQLNATKTRLKPRQIGFIGPTE